MVRPESLDTETLTAVMPVLEDTWKSGGITTQEWRAILGTCYTGSRSPSSLRPQSLKCKFDNVLREA